MNVLTGAGVCVCVCQVLFHVSEQLFVRGRVAHSTQLFISLFPWKQLQPHVHGGGADSKTAAQWTGVLLLMRFHGRLLWHTCGSQFYCLTHLESQ